MIGVPHTITSVSDRLARNHARQPCQQLHPIASVIFPFLGVRFGRKRGNESVYAVKNKLSESADRRDPGDIRVIQNDLVSVFDFGDGTVDGKTVQSKPGGKIVIVAECRGVKL